MNKAQKIVLGLGFLAAFLTLVFPPSNYGHFSGVLFTDVGVRFDLLAYHLLGIALLCGALLVCFHRHR